MKKFFFACCFLFLTGHLFSQQEGQFTQFMYNKLGYNPGYAGNSETACITAMYRKQWIGLEGAPSAQLIAFNMPLMNKRVGIGGAIWRNSIGVTETLNAEGAYAYRVPLGRGILGLGVMASVRLMRQDFNKTSATQSGDSAIPLGLQSKYVPNFGFGAYYGTSRFFIGASAPRLLENNIDFAEEGLVVSREIRHLYFMTGIIFELSESTKLQPQILMKMVKGAPFDADLNANFIVLDRYTVGMSYRLGGSKSSSIGESFSLLLGAQITDNVLFGLSYDLTMSELRDYNSGTVEGVFKYCFGKNAGDEYLNPRFF